MKNEAVTATKIEKKKKRTAQEQQQQPTRYTLSKCNKFICSDNASAQFANITQTPHSQIQRTKTYQKSQLQSRATKPTK